MVEFKEARHPAEIRSRPAADDSAKQCSREGSEGRGGEVCHREVFKELWEVWAGVVEAGGHGGFGAAGSWMVLADGRIWGDE